MIEPIPFGVLLKQYRMAAALTQEALAERANLSTRAVSDLERGINRAPRYDTLNLLAGALSLSAEERASLFAAARPPLHVRNAPDEQGTRPSSEQALVLLPAPPTPLVGREEELNRALELLQGTGGQQLARLLTLTGTGGVGKTRLALQIALDLRDRFADGVAYVDLAPIRDHSLVPQVVAQALGLTEEPDRSLPEQLREFLHDRRSLLLLDNFEQIVEAADFVGDLLANCPQLRVLVTSRVPLRLRAEHQLLLAPLPLPAAVELFLERIERSGVRDPLDRRDTTGKLAEALSTVEAICEQVDRLPLAIELAAAHARVLSLPLLLERLQNRLQMLRGGARDLPERQRTMHGAIAWSYNLLDAMEQRTFRALAVFAGGCTLEAAEAVCTSPGAIAPAASENASGNAYEDVYFTTIALAEAGLVQVESTGDGIPRYYMLEVIREYALVQLRASGEEEQYARRHAQYYAQLAEQAEQNRPGQAAHETRLERESPNARAALRWAYEHGEVTLGLRLATWFGLFWFKHGQMSESGFWLEKMLDLDTGAASAAREAVPPAVRLRALYSFSRHNMNLGRRDPAVALAQKGLALAEQVGDQANVSNMLAILGAIALAYGNDDQAASHFTGSYVAATRAGDDWVKGLALLNLGEIARKRGDLERAGEFLEASLELVRANDMAWGVANTLALLARLAYQQHDYALAKARYRESLELFRTLSNTTYTAWCLEGVAALAYAEQRYDRAARLCAAAAALRAGANTPLPSGEQEEVDRIVMTARAELGEKAFAENWDAGSSMAQHEAITYALAAG